MTNKQQQEGGQNSENYQAGRDLVVNNGISAAEAYTLAKSIIQDQLLELREQARTTASERAEELITEFIEKLSAKNGRLEAIRDPDVQYALMAAQREYARSGRDFHRRMLSDFLAEKCRDNLEELEDIVLSEAIETVRKLSIRQISTITVNWLLRWVKAGKVTTQEALTSWMESNVAPFLESIAVSIADYKHIEYCGCGPLSLGTVTLPVVLTGAYPGLFQAGLAPGQIPDSLGTIPVGPPLFTPCLNDLSKPQVAAIDENTAKALAKAHGYSENAETYAALLKQNILDHSKIETNLKALNPFWVRLYDLCASTQMLNINLTSVGFAIAHSHWAATTNNTDTPLSIWVSESALE